MAASRVVLNKGKHRFNRFIACLAYINIICLYSVGEYEIPMRIQGKQIFVELRHFEECCLENNAAIIQLKADSPKYIYILRFRS